MAVVLVTGGTGTLGRHVVGRLLGSGAAVRVLSRGGDPPEGAALVRGDLVSGQGLGEALAGVDAVVHCASDPRRLEVEIDGTRRLLDGAAAAGRPHVVYVSIVGVDRILLGYYQAKLAAETFLRDSGLDWTILRATQFNELVLQGVAVLARSPMIPLPKDVRAQPVDTRDVADRLAELALGAPAGRVPDVGGPRVETAEELVRTYVSAARLRRRVAAVPAPGRTMRAFRAGANLVPDGDLGTRTFEAFVRERVQPGQRVTLTYYRKRRR